MLNIILLGEPAAGKATQAKILVRKYKMYDFDMGKELRKARQKDRKLNSVLKETQDKGKLTPTGIVRDIIRKTIVSLPKDRSILFDGTPKMLGEAKIVHSLMNKVGRTNKSTMVLYLTIPMDEVLKRMLGRKEYYKGKYSKRADDSMEAVKNRIRYYKTNIADVTKFFKSKYNFRIIDGLGTPKQVEQKIAKAIKEFVDKN